jgi:hypothetical protein
MPSTGVLHRVVHVRTDVSEVGISFIIRVSLIPFSLMIEMIRSSESRFLQEQHGIILAKHLQIRAAENGHDIFWALF